MEFEIRNLQIMISNSFPYILNLKEIILVTPHKLQSLLEFGHIILKSLIMATHSKRPNKNNRFKPYPTPDKETDEEPGSSSQFNFVIPLPGSKNPTPWKQNPAVPPDSLVPRIL